MLYFSHHQSTISSSFEVFLLTFIITLSIKSKAQTPHHFPLTLCIPHPTLQFPQSLYNLKLMQLLQESSRLKAATCQLYYLRANETQKQWARDNAAALKIQSKFKMYVRRKEFLRKKAAAIKIETHFRAYYARRLFKQRLSADLNAKNLHYFAQQATLIQKVFRGYFERKYIHNFYMRKNELNALQQKNNQFREELEQFGKAQAQEAEEYQQQLAQAEFQALAKNLHHLSSTKGIPGVYNSPFSLEKPAVFDRTVQEHLKSAFRQSYKWKAPNRETIMKYSMRVSK